MNRAADLLVEQDLLREAVEAEVGAEGNLSKVAGAFIGVERGDQDIFVLAGRCLDDLATLKSEADVGDLAAAGNDRKGEANAALDRVLDRPGENLAGREVALAVGVVPGPARDRHPEIGIGARYMDFPARRQPVD